jgi:hypothetical protein
VTASGGTLHQEWVRIPRSKEILLLKGEGALADCKRLSVACPLGQPGDRLWVRETWRLEDFVSLGNGKFSAAVAFQADENRSQIRLEGGEEVLNERFGWRPSIHMPRWACRLVLPLVSVRVERVQEITEEDAKAEGLRRTENGWTDGANGYDVTSARMAFRELWASIYGEASWDANPWVWVAEWKDIEVSK